MRTLFSSVAAIFLLLGALVLLAQAPYAAGGGKKGGGKGGGFVPKNLQVLDRATFPAAMQSFVQALGLLDQGGCNYCHVEDRASDEKMQKVIARNMITLVREINAQFPDGKQHVTCYTCHGGSTTPATAP
jgi:Photosynthetic reaction centre cytochrome C subunit